MKPVKYRVATPKRKSTYITNLGEFRSQKEAERYSVLLQMQEKGDISELQRNVVFTLLEPISKKRNIKQELKTKHQTISKHVCVKGGITLVVNFVYRDKKGKLNVEMVKERGQEYKDPVYVIKNKLMYYFYRINLIEN